jgi:hypothetical protein
MFSEMKSAGIFFVKMNDILSTLICSTTGEEFNSIGIYWEAAQAGGHTFVLIDSVRGLLSFKRQQSSKFINSDNLDRVTTIEDLTLQSEIEKISFWPFEEPDIETVYSLALSWSAALPTTTIEEDDGVYVRLHKNATRELIEKCVRNKRTIFSLLPEIEKNGLYLDTNYTFPGIVIADSSLANHEHKMPLWTDRVPGPTPIAEIPTLPVYEDDRLAVSRARLLISKMKDLNQAQKRELELFLECFNMVIDGDLQIQSGRIPFCIWCENYRKTIDTLVTERCIDASEFRGQMSQKFKGELADCSLFVIPISVQKEVEGIIHQFATSPHGETPVISMQAFFSLAKIFKIPIPPRLEDYERGTHQIHTNMGDVVVYADGVDARVYKPPAIRHVPYFGADAKKLSNTQLKNVMRYLMQPTMLIDSRTVELRQKVKAELKLREIPEN